MIEVTLKVNEADARSVIGAIVNSKDPMSMEAFMILKRQVMTPLLHELKIRNESLMWKPPNRIMMTEPPD